MKIPFDIKYRQQIESGEYKVETRDGKPVRIICWDMDSYNPIVALISNYPNYDGSLSEHIFSYDVDGHYNTVCPHDEDLFIITPEEELTPFEQEVSDIVEYCKEHGVNVASSYAKRHAKILLNFAREELVGEMLTSVPKESALYKAGVLDGKAEALKDLPRWREWGGIWGDSYGLPIALVHDDRGFRFSSVIGVGEKEFIMLDDLKKLPGFKED